MNSPNLYLADDLREWGSSSSADGIHYYAARPLGFDGFELRRRLFLAWQVFIGRYDALRWQADAPPLYKEDRKHG